MKANAVTEKAAQHVTRFQHCVQRIGPDSFTTGRINLCQKETFKAENPMPPCLQHITHLDTDYSVIVHSQGGLTLSSLLNSCYDKNNPGRPTKACPLS